MLHEGRSSPFHGIEIGLKCLPPDYFQEVLETFSSPSFLNPEKELGRALVSAIVHGALLNREAWDAFVVALPTCSLHGDLPAIEMIIPSPKSPTGLTTWRWYMDPATKALVRRWHDTVPADGRRHPNLKADQCLAAFLGCLSRAPSDLVTAVENCGIGPHFNGAYECPRFWLIKHSASFQRWTCLLITIVDFAAITKRSPKRLPPLFFNPSRQEKVGNRQPT